MLNNRLQLCKSSRQAGRQRNQPLSCSFTKGTDKNLGHLRDCGGVWGVWGGLGGGGGVRGRGVCRNEMELVKLVEVVISTTHPLILTHLEFPARKRVFS